jgi:hypothetical protein
VDVFLQALMNPGEMTRLQWLLVAIMLFIFVGSLFFVWKLYGIVMNSRKTPYVPNIGLKRMREEAAAREAEKREHPGS